MTRSRQRVLFGLLLIFAAWLRWQGLDWDQGQHLHPDERFLTMVETAIEFPSSPAEYFDTARSPLNPANRGHRFFVYGTFPIFFVRAVGLALGMADYSTIHLVGRFLSGLFDLGTCVVTWRLGTMLAGPAVGLSALALYAASPIAVQQAHFFTVDTFGAFFAALSLLATLQVARGGGARWDAAFAVAFGLMLACRINLALLAPFYPLARAYRWWTGGERLGRTVWTAAASLVAAAVVFRIAQPYAFAGPGFFGLAIAPQFLESMESIRRYATGEADYPPGVQWIGRTRVLFPARNLLLWGLGPAFGAAAAGGILRALFRRASRAHPAEAVGAGRILALWALALFGYHAAQFTATLRYFLPIVPALAVAAAWWLAGRPGFRRRALLGGVLLATALWAVAFTAIYRRPITRVEASRWILENVPPGATIAVEHWDDALPLPIPDAPAAPYRRIELPLYDEDGPAKRRILLDRLTAADWISISSNRLYRSIPRTPWRYPLGRRYYELLFSGELGFRLERSFTSYPRLGRLEIPDDEAEEAFTVYDHPQVLLFRKTESFSRERVEALLEAVPLKGIVRVAPREASALYRRHRPRDVPLPAAAGVRTAVGERALESTSLGAAVRWLLALEILGAALFLLALPHLRGLDDAGWGLAKLAAWLVPGYAGWLLTSYGLASNSTRTMLAVGAAIVLAGAARAAARRPEIRTVVRDRRREIAAVEALFLVSFALFTAARAYNPTIYWGEKPMDFAILNAVLRSETMPPADPWFAGSQLNYFYFGHAVVAFFAKLTEVPAALAFNLAIPTVGGLLAVAAFLVGRRAGGSIRSGLGSAVAVTFLGNLEGVRLYLRDPSRRFDFDWFWATSRVVESTINEFPAWNLLFADLHAHVLAQPLGVALLYVGILWLDAGRRPSGLAVGALAAWLLGAVGVTSTWSLPVAASLQLALLVTAWRERTGGTAGIVRALAVWIAVAAVSRLLFLPFWMHYRRPAGRGVGWETEHAPLADVAILFGAFLIAIVPPLLSRLPGWRPRGRLVAAVGVAAVACAAAGLLRSPATGLFAALLGLGAVAWWFAPDRAVRLAGLWVACAGGVGAMTEVVYAWDRMNTVFKYYLEVWMLLGCAAGVLVRLGLERGRWVRPVWRPLVAATAAGALFTSVACGFALTRFPRMPGPTPTLDGTAYLRTSRPAEWAAFRFLQSRVSGVPVILEAHGPSYGEYSRVSMNTGLPTVLGWQYHLFQQAHSQSEIDERAEDVRTIYSTTDAELAERLLRKYHVDLVFVGGLEKRTYPADGLAKFASSSALQPVFRDREVTIYAVPGALAAAKTWVDAVAPTPPSERRIPPGFYREPRDVARAPDGSLWVADFGNRRVQHVGADLQPIAALGYEGDAPGEFRDPCGVAVGPDGAVYVADTWNHRVQKLGADGRYETEWTAGFYGPRGIAVAADGSMYVADTGNHRVVHLGADGAVRGEWGREEGPAALKLPVGIALGPDGAVYVADVGNARVAVFSGDGRLLRSWSMPAWRRAALAEPHLDVGPDGVVWVTDPAENAVRLFSADGAALGPARARSPLSQPLGIAVVGERRAVVANATSHSLVVVER